MWALEDEVRFMQLYEMRRQSRDGWSIGFAVALVVACLAACSDSPDEKPSNNGGSGVTQGIAANAAIGAQAGAGGQIGGAGVPSQAGAGANAPPAGAGGTPAAGAGGSSAGSGGSGGAGGDSAGTGGTAGEPAEEPCTKDVEPMPGDNACTSPLKPGDDRLCEFSFSGGMRRYFIYAPPSYNPCKPASLVLDCHGASESIEVHTGKEGFRADSPLGYGSSWRRAVQGDNAVVITPEGVGLFWSESSDAAFLNEVATQVEKIADIDPERRYLTGISMGGMITVETACADATRWRGISPVAMLTNTCASLSRPLPAIFFHAMSDSITSYPDSRELAADMAALNKCKNGPVADAMVFGGANSSKDQVCFAMPPMPGGPDAADPYAVPYAACPASAPVTTCELWDQCDEGVEVVYCTVDADSQIYGGHLLYNNDTGLSLPALAWPFLKKFQK